MSLPIERWARQAVLLEADGRYDPVASRKVLQDIDDLKALEFQTWRQRQRALNDGGGPQALEGVYAGLAALPPAGTLANVASVNGENAMWGTAQWTPLPANGILAPEAYRLAVSYQVVTVATPASVTVNPRLGSFASGATSSGGVQMGASAAIALTASITTNWFFIGDMTFRAVGLPGLNTTAMGAFHLMAKDTTAGNGTIVTNQLIGHTLASFDSSIASGFVIGNANTVTTINYSVLQIHWMSWN